MPDPTPHLPPSEIERLRGLHAAATAGPYDGRELHPDWPMPAAVCLFGVVSLTTGKEVLRCWEREDARFYAEIHNAFPALAAAASRAADLERLVALLEDDAASMRFTRRVANKQISRNILAPLDGSDERAKAELYDLDAKEEQIERLKAALHPGRAAEVEGK